MDNSSNIEFPMFGDGDDEEDLVRYVMSRRGVRGNALFPNTNKAIEKENKGFNIKIRKKLDKKQKASEDQPIIAPVHVITKKTNTNIPISVDNIAIGNRCEQQLNIPLDLPQSLSLGKRITAVDSENTSNLTETFQFTKIQATSTPYIHGPPPDNKSKPIDQPDDGFPCVAININLNHPKENQQAAIEATQNNNQSVEVPQLVNFNTSRTIIRSPRSLHKNQQELCISPQSTVHSYTPRRTLLPLSPLLKEPLRKNHPNCANSTQQTNTEHIYGSPSKATNLRLSQANRKIDFSTPVKNSIINRVLQQKICAQQRQNSTQTIDDSPEKKINTTPLKHHETSQIQTRSSSLAFIQPAHKQSNHSANINKNQTRSNNSLNQIGADNSENMSNDSISPSLEKQTLTNNGSKRTLIVQKNCTLPYEPNMTNKEPQHRGKTNVITNNKTTEEVSCSKWKRSKVQKRRLISSSTESVDEQIDSPNDDIPSSFIANENGLESCAPQPFTYIPLRNSPMTSPNICLSQNVNTSNGDELHSTINKNILPRLKSAFVRLNRIRRDNMNSISIDKESSSFKAASKATYSSKSTSRTMSLNKDHVIVEQSQSYSKRNQNKYIHCYNQNEIESDDSLNENMTNDSISTLFEKSSVNSPIRINYSKRKLIKHNNFALPYDSNTKNKKPSVLKTDQSRQTNKISTTERTKKIPCAKEKKSVVRQRRLISSSTEFDDKQSPNYDMLSSSIANENGLECCVQQPSTTNILLSDCSISIDEYSSKKTASFKAATKLISSSSESDDQSDNDMSSSSIVNENGIKSCNSQSSTIYLPSRDSCITSPNIFLSQNINISTVGNGDRLHSTFNKNISNCLSIAEDSSKDTSSYKVLAKVTPPTKSIISTNTLSLNNDYVIVDQSPRFSQKLFQTVINEEKTRRANLKKPKVPKRIRTKKTIHPDIIKYDQLGKMIKSHNKVKSKNRIFRSLYQKGTSDMEILISPPVSPPASPAPSVSPLASQSVAALAAPSVSPLAKPSPLILRNKSAKALESKSKTNKGKPPIKKKKRNPVIDYKPGEKLSVEFYQPLNRNDNDPPGVRRSKRQRRLPIIYWSFSHNNVEGPSTTPGIFERYRELRRNKSSNKILPNINVIHSESSDADSVHNKEVENLLQQLNELCDSDCSETEADETIQQVRDISQIRNESTKSYVADTLDYNTIAQSTIMNQDHNLSPNFIQYLLTVDEHDIFTHNLTNEPSSTEWDKADLVANRVGGIVYINYTNNSNSVGYIRLDPNAKRKRFRTKTGVLITILSGTLEVEHDNINKISTVTVNETVEVIAGAFYQIRNKTQKLGLLMYINQQ